VGLGTEILFILALGLLILGPRRLHTLVAHVARAKAQFEEASRGLKSQLEAELDATHQERETKTNTSHELIGDQ
jgi:Sec-independent protein translocase protein TatA